MSGLIDHPDKAMEVKFPVKSMGQLYHLKLQEIDNNKLTARYFDPVTDKEVFEY